MLRPPGQHVQKNRTSQETKRKLWSKKGFFCLLRGGTTAQLKVGKAVRDSVREREEELL